MNLRRTVSDLYVSPSGGITGPGELPVPFHSPCLTSWWTSSMFLSSHTKLTLFWKADKQNAAASCTEETDKTVAAEDEAFSYSRGLCWHGLNIVHNNFKNISLISKEPAEDARVKRRDTEHIHDSLIKGTSLISSSVTLRGRHSAAQLGCVMV